MKDLAVVQVFGSVLMFCDLFVISNFSRRRLLSPKSEIEIGCNFPPVLGSGFPQFLTQVFPSILGFFVL